MKKVYILIITLCLAISTLAQPPEKMNYQAVLRNSSNELIVNQEVTIKISIRQNAADGIIVYNETQSVTTNSNGLVTLEIGNEAGFSNINWANADYYIQIQVDPEGGTNYTITGVSQLLSVPYALHAKTTSQSVTETDPVYSASDAATISSSNISNWNNAFGWGNHATAGYLTAFTENDPVFTSHISYGINSTDTEQWDSAYSWGNHAEMGYLTSVSAESDPIFSSSDAYGINASDISNWTTAYNWGDHSIQGYLTTFTENDPDFNTSPASGISSTNISNWNTAYGWGNHANEGYLTTFTESDPIFGASAASGISSTNISNWNTAYGWGNHATQGYLTSFSETDPYAVKLTGNQSISGEKTFNSRTNILQIEVSPVNTGNRYGYIDFHGDNTYTDYALRLIRNNTGVNAESWLKHRGTGVLYLSADDAGKLGFRTNGSTRMYIDSNGEIGVGTTSPGAKMEINSAGYTGDILFQVKDNAGDPVFTVYPDAVEVTVPDYGTKANKHGSFTVTGRSTKGDKATTQITRISKENYLIGHDVAPGITGTKNSIYGYEAGNSLIGGSNNVMIGYQAGNKTNANNNVFIGTTAGMSNTTGISNVYIGTVSGLETVSGSYNVAIGGSSGTKENLGGNVFIGNGSGVNNTGGENVFLGHNAGFYNTGSYSVMIGYQAGANETGSKKLYIDNSSTSSPLIYGDFDIDYLRVNGRFRVYANYGDYAGVFFNDGNSSTRDGISIQCGTDDNSGTNYMIRFADGNNTGVGYILSTGGVVSYGSKSHTPGKSKFTKFNNDAISILSQIDVGYFKASKEIDYSIVGFNGKQIMELLPESTFYNEEEGEYYTDKSALVPILTKAIQEQQKKILDMEKELTKVDQLQMELENLKQKINQLSK
jgi:hypothetical protein